MAHSDIAARLRRAASLHRAGKLAQAERMYRAVLRGAPDEPDALFMLGSLALQTGRARQALPLLERAVRRKPLQPEFQVGLGNVLRLLGRASEADACYRQALALRPDYPEVRLNLGNLLAEAGRPAEALAEYSAALARSPTLRAARMGRAKMLLALGRAAEAHADAEAVLARDPAHAEALHLRARAALARGDEPAAEADLRRALAADPKLAVALNDLGALLERRGAVDQAEALYRRALEAQRAFPDALRNLARRLLAAAQWREAGQLWDRLRLLQPADGPALLNLAYCLQKFGKPKLAAERYRQYLERNPDDPQARNNLASCLLAQGENAAAEAEYRKVLERAPQHPEALHNLGRALLVQQRLADAEAALRSARRLRRRDPQVAASLGDVRRAQGRAERAALWFGRALRLDSGFAKAEDTLVYTSLALGRFETGWRLQRKVRLRDRRWQSQLARFPQPEWRGEALAGKRLLVWSEQGLGDQIMYAGCLPEVLALGGSVVLEAGKRLATLFARGFPGVEVVESAGWNPAPRLLQPDIDWQNGMSALPWFTRGGRDAFPARQGYLRPDPARVARWQAELAALGPGLKVGISWRGGTQWTGSERRSTGLARWRGLLTLDGARFVSLQYGDVAAELAALEREHGLRLPHWPEAGSDMEEHAALIGALDLVISVCNTAIHMAGALGKPVWVLVPARAGWRYLQRGARMPWYPSARLYRQPRPGEWGVVFAEIERALGAGLLR